MFDKLQPGKYDDQQLWPSLLVIGAIGASGIIMMLAMQ